MSGLVIPVVVKTSGANDVGKNVSKGLDSARSGLKRFSDSVNKAFDSSAIGNFRKSIESSLPQGLQNITSKFSTLGMVAVGAAAAIYKGLSSAADEIEQIQNKADALGISMKTMASIDAFGKMSGLGEKPAKNIEKFTVKLGEAISGDIAAQKAFDGLGVSIADASGNIKNTSQVIDESIQKINQIKSPAERAAKSVELFGKGAAQSIAALSGGIENLSRQMQSDGLILPDDAIARIKQFDQSSDTLGQRIKTISQDLVSQFGPAFAAGMDVAGDALQGLWIIAKPTFQMLGLGLAVVMQGWKNLTNGIKFAVAEVALNMQELIDSFNAPLPKSMQIDFKANIDEKYWLKVQSDAEKNIKDIGQIADEFLFPDPTGKGEELSGPYKDVLAELRKIEAEKKRQREQDKRDREAAKAEAEAERERERIQAESEKELRARGKAHLQEVAAIRKMGQDLLAQQIREQEEAKQKQMDSDKFLSEQKRIIAETDYQYAQEIRKAQRDEMLADYQLAIDLAQGQADKIQSIEEQRSKSIAALDQMEFKRKLDLSSNLANLMINQAKATFGDNKAFQIAEATMTGIKAAMDAFAWGTALGGPLLGTIMASASTAFSTAQVAKISGVHFASGGFPTGANKGIVVNERGQEAILNASATARLGRKNIDYLNSGGDLSGFGQRSQNQTINITYNPTITGGTGLNTAQILKEHSRELTKIVQDGLRRGY